MEAKVLRPLPFHGKTWMPGEIMTDADINDPRWPEVTGQGFIELEGFGGNAGGGKASMSAGDLEALRSLQASFDRFREDAERRLGMIDEKLDALLKSAKRK
jgi:hypothetical protein